MNVFVKVAFAHVKARNNANGLQQMGGDFHNM